LQPYNSPAHHTHHPHFHHHFFLSILIILIIPIIFIILVILFVLIIVVTNSFLLPSLWSSSVSFIVLVSNLINIKKLALFMTCSNSEKTT